MMRRAVALALVSWALGVGTSVRAAHVELTLDEGRVWLVAKDATVSEILSEWARIGETTIVNGERLPGGPVTLQLDNVSEPEALDMLLRSVAGFVAVRRAASDASASRFDRILILPTSRVPRAPTVEAAAAELPPVFYEPEPQPAPDFTAPGVERLVGPDGLPVPDDQEGAPTPLPPYGSMPPGFSPVDAVPVPAPDARDAGTSPPSGDAAPQVPVGVPVPGMIVPAQQPQAAPR